VKLERGAGSNPGRTAEASQCEKRGGEARLPSGPRNSVRSAVSPCSRSLAVTKATRVPEVDVVGGSGSSLAVAVECGHCERLGGVSMVPDPFAEEGL